MAVASKLGRRYLGCELSPQYAARIRERLSAARPGDPLDGAPEPLKSVPATRDGRRVGKRRSAKKTGKRTGKAAETLLFPTDQP